MCTSGPNTICEKRMPRPSSASAQSDQELHFPLTYLLNTAKYALDWLQSPFTKYFFFIILFKIKNNKIKEIYYHDYKGWSL